MVKIPIVEAVSPLEVNTKFWTFLHQNPGEIGCGVRQNAWLMAR
jgi:hypothetical protein